MKTVKFGPHRTTRVVYDKKALKALIKELEETLKTLK